MTLGQLRYGLHILTVGSLGAQHLRVWGTLGESPFVLHKFTAPKLVEPVCKTQHHSLNDSFAWANVVFHRSGPNGISKCKSTFVYNRAACQPFFQTAQLTKSCVSKPKNSRLSSVKCNTFVCFSQTRTKWLTKHLKPPNTEVHIWVDLMSLSVDQIGDSTTFLNGRTPR